MLNERIAGNSLYIYTLFFLFYYSSSSLLCCSSLERTHYFFCCFCFISRWLYFHPFFANTLDSIVSFQFCSHFSIRRSFLWIFWSLPVIIVIVVVFVFFYSFFCCFFFYFMYEMLNEWMARERKHTCIFCRKISKNRFLEYEYLVFVCLRECIAWL